MFEVKLLSDKNEINTALKFAEYVFMEFEAPEFSARGTESFIDFVRGKRLAQMISDGDAVIWGCYSGEALVGMLALRDNNHISLAFVRGDLHRQGIGRMLCAEAKKYALAYGTEKITVNASSYGIPFYRAMGFKETDMQLIADGILYTPMAAKLIDNERK